MNVAIYARVSSEVQEQRGTIGSQVEVLRARMAAEGHEIVAEFLDDGYSGARLDRPGLDALRDAAEAGVIEAVWCLTPDRLARSYAYQMLVLDELDRLGCRVRFTDAPAIDDDPQVRPPTQMQGVIAEYERAKIAERYRRGKLFRVRAGETIFWKVPYGYRRVPRTAEGPARLEIHEPEAAIVRGIFDEYTAAGRSMRAITRRLYEQGVPTPTGRPVWSSSTLGGMLRNRSYMGTAEWFRHETVAPPAPGKSHGRQTRRPKEDWVRVPVPAIITEEVFEAAQRVKTDNSMFSPRRTIPGTWLLRGLVYCGAGNVKAHAHPMRSTAENGTRKNRYYSCYHHDTLRAGGVDQRCTERRIRADELDAFVFAQVRDILLRPDVLLAGERALVAEQPRLTTRSSTLSSPASPAAWTRQPPSADGSPTSTKPVNRHARTQPSSNRTRQPPPPTRVPTGRAHSPASRTRHRQPPPPTRHQLRQASRRRDRLAQLRPTPTTAPPDRRASTRPGLASRAPTTHFLHPAPETHPKARRRGSPRRGLFSEDRLRSLGVIHPSGLPSPVTPGWNGSTWAFPEALHPGRAGAEDARRGGTGHRARTWNNTHATSDEPPILVFTRIVRPRVAPRVSGRSASRPACRSAKSEQVPRRVCTRNCVGLDERDVHVYNQREVCISASDCSCTAWRRRRAPRRAGGALLGGARASGPEPGVGGRGR